MPVRNARFRRCAVYLLGILAISCLNVASLQAWPGAKRKAIFPETSNVAKIEASVVGMPSGEAIARTVSVQDGKQIAEVLGLLSKYRDGWKKILVTPPAGIVQISLVSTDPKAISPLCVIRLGKGWASTDIDGHAHTRAMSTEDQQSLLGALGIETSALGK
jgi:hypothetical protein